MNRHRILFLLLLFVCIPNTILHAAEFEGGAGQMDDPYQIATAGQLLSLASDPNLQSKHFILVADIDMDPNSFPVVPRSDGRGDDKMSMSGMALTTGSLDGDGHRIFNLRLSSGYSRGRSAEYGAPALLESIGLDAIVRDLSLEGTSTDARDRLSRVGMLTLQNEGLIQNCRVEGRLSANTGGGLAVANFGTIMHCHSTVDMTGGSGLVGENWGIVLGCTASGNVTEGQAGLVGENWGTIFGCTASGSVTEGQAGLVGDNQGTIRYCCASGDVHASGDLAGGLVGTNGGEISNCCATGSVWADGLAAGLVGGNEGTITHCYATGSGSMALVADRYRDGTIRGCYVLSARDGGGADNGLGMPLTDAQMRRRESFVGWDFSGTELDGTLDEWTMPEEGGYPVPTVLQTLELPGAGTAEDPYLVETYPEFMAISREPAASYRLVSNLDLGGLSFPSALVPFFQGHFDGDDHCISNFVLTGEHGLGIFGTLCSEATVTALNIRRSRMVLASEAYYPEATGFGILAALSRGRVSDCATSVEITVESKTYFRNLGGLIGINDAGEIRRCSARLATAYPSTYYQGGSAQVGGLVGSNSGTILECHASAYANGPFVSLGGLVGCNEGSITDCYADGYLSGYFVMRSRPPSPPANPFVGGLVGENAGNIVASYAATAVAFTPAGGGLVGGDSEDGILASYFLAESEGGGPDNGLGVALSDAAMRRQASFADWDFADVWIICEAADYPRLRWEAPACEQ